jgi:hypothetical protein
MAADTAPVAPANVSRDPKQTRAFKPADFDPHPRRDTPPGVVKGRNFDILKMVFAGPCGTGNRGDGKGRPEGRLSTGP